jgi:ubiquinone/menaquinone biosynthesis C-methylase UbiE
MKKYLSNDFDFKDYVSVSDECSLWSAPFGLKLLDFINYKRNISALDIGFGTGFPLTELALRLGESSTVYGIDPWTDAIARAKKKIEYYRISNIKIIEGVAESIPLEDSSIDLIVSNNGINNVSDINKVLSECSRIIKTGGQFVMTMNLDKSMFEFYEQLEKVLSELNLIHEIELMHKHIYQKRRPLGEMVAMIEKSGFAIKDIEHDQFNYKFSDGSAMLNHYFIRLAFMDSWIKIVPENLLGKIFETIEKRLNEQAEIFGGIKLSIPFVLINSIKQ